MGPWKTPEHWRPATAATLPYDLIEPHTDRTGKERGEFLVEAHRRLQHRIKAGSHRNTAVPSAGLNNCHFRRSVSDPARNRIKIAREAPLAHLEAQGNNVSMAAMKVVRRLGRLGRPPLKCLNSACLPAYLPAQPGQPRKKSARCRGRAEGEKRATVRLGPRKEAASSSQGRPPLTRSLSEGGVSCHGVRDGHARNTCTVHSMQRPACAAQGGAGCLPRLCDFDQLERRRGARTPRWESKVGMSRRRRGESFVAGSNCIM